MEDDEKEEKKDVEVKIDLENLESQGSASSP